MTRWWSPNGCSSVVDSWQEVGRAGLTVRAHVGLPEQEAALEKARAGEGRDVEHVALETEGTLQLAEAKRGAAPRRTAKRAKAQARNTGALAVC